jgi:hypothetical protein
MMDHKTMFEGLVAAVLLVICAGVAVVLGYPMFLLAIETAFNFWVKGTLR